MTKRIYQEHSRCCSNRCAVGDADPGAHAEAVGEFPLATHVGVDADQEVEDHQLEGTAVVQPLIEAGGFPDGVEVQADGVAGRHNSTGDDVVAIHEAAGNGLADAVDVDGGSSDEGNDEADRSSKKSGDHKSPKPSHIESVVGGSYPLTKRFP